jgi:hypothetical protein
MRSGPAGAVAGRRDLPEEVADLLVTDRRPAARMSRMSEDLRVLHNRFRSDRP